MAISEPKLAVSRGDKSERGSPQQRKQRLSHVQVEKAEKDVAVIEGQRKAVVVGLLRT